MEEHDRMEGWMNDKRKEKLLRGRAVEVLFLFVKFFRYFSMKWFLFSVTPPKKTLFREALIFTYQTVPSSAKRFVQLYLGKLFK